MIPITTGQNLLQLLQDRNRRKHNFDAVFKCFWEINNNNHIYTTISNKYLKESFITDDKQELDNGIINNFSDSDFGNDLDFRLNNLFLGVHYKFGTGIFTFKQGFHLRNLSWDINQQNDIRRIKWFVLPDFLAKIEFNKSKKIQINYSLRTSFADASRLANQFYLQSYNSVAKFLQEVGNTLQQNKNNNYSYSFGIETLFEIFPNIEIDYKRSIGDFTSSDSSSKFTTNEPFVNINYDFENRALNQKNRFDVANFTLSYKKENSTWICKAFSNNLFNTGFKRNSSFSQFLISDTRTFILPRVLMFSIGYNL